MQMMPKVRRELISASKKLKNRPRKSQQCEAESDIVKAEMDREDGILVYEVEIKYDSMEYDFTINGATGVIVERSANPYMTDERMEKSAFRLFIEKSSSNMNCSILDFSLRIPISGSGSR